MFSDVVLVSKHRKMVTVQNCDAVIFLSKSFKDKDNLITGKQHDFKGPDFALGSLDGSVPATQMS